MKAAYVGVSQKHGSQLSWGIQLLSELQETVLIMEGECRWLACDKIIPQMFLSAKISKPHSTWCLEQLIQKVETVFIKVINNLKETKTTQQEMSEFISC